MRQRGRIIGVVSVVVVAVAVAAAVYGRGGMPSVGAAAPDFTLAAQDGKPASLKDFRNKWVVLYFYPANFTRMGNLQAAKFQEDLPQYAAANTVLLGVSSETPASNRDFTKEQKLTFPLLSDPDTDVAEAYGSTKYFHVRKLAARNTFIIDPQGRVAQVFLNIDPERHSPEVLDALAALQKQ
jgi:thioredoxin-dependent peroxiredoxin